MGTPTISLAIPHCPWRPERVESMARLRLALDPGQHPDSKSPEVVAYREFTERAPNHVWSERLWRWLAEQDSTHCLVLQDDVVVAPNFWPALHAMLEAVPDQVIGLETVHPCAPALAAEGHRWLTTSEGLVGVGYCMPRADLVDFLEWRRNLKPGAVEAISEDTLLCCWLLSTGRRCYHPLPTILDHDTSLPSTYSNDLHPNRRPRVRWDTVSDGVSFWENPNAWKRKPESVLHLGRFYEAGQVPALCLKWCPGFTEADYRRAMADDGRDVKRRLVLEARVREMREGRASAAARIMLCTPHRGTVHPAYSRSVWLASRMQDVEIEVPIELHETRLQCSDIVLRRSQFVRHFLESDCTHLFFVDSDIEFAPQVLRGMLVADQHFVAAPYPMRDFLRWPDPVPGVPPEASAYRYALQTPDGEPLKVDHDGVPIAEVSRIGLGCALLSRTCLERMTKEYEELTFLDGEGPGGVPTVALFQLMIRDGKLRGEDQSFCQRWRDMGERVWMYLGPGSPVTHHGEHAYRGHIEAFGLRRVSQ